MTTKKERQAAFEKIFVNNAWGNKSNAGKFYKRPYNKTQRSKGLI